MWGFESLSCCQQLSYSLRAASRGALRGPTAALTADLPKAGGRFDLARNTWSTVTTTDAPSRRRGHSALWTGTEMLIWGGRNDFGSTVTFYDDTFAYTPARSLVLYLKP